MKHTGLWIGLAVWATANASLAQTPASVRDMHLLVAAQGTVALQRPGWPKAVPAGVGTVLRRGDLVLLATGGAGTVVCADLTLRALPAGRLSGMPCAVPKAALVYEGSLLAATRGDESDELPLVVAPRRTSVLSPRPLLRWSVPGGTGTGTGTATGAATPAVTVAVTVTVKGPGVTWSARPPAGSTSMPYPADAPALQPGASYRVSVSAAGRSSDEAAEPGSGFSLLAGAAADEARAGVERIGTLGLGADASRLLLAHFLGARGLQAEAIEQLEAAAPAPRALLTLGTLYQSVGLVKLAEARLLRAAEGAAAAGDIEAQAQAKSALGSLYFEALGLRDDAARVLGDAAALFVTLGDSAAATQARDKASRAKGS